MKKLRFILIVVMSFFQGFGASPANATATLSGLGLAEHVSNQVRSCDVGPYTINERDNRIYYSNHIAMQTTSVIFSSGSIAVILDLYNKCNLFDITCATNNIGWASVPFLVVGGVLFSAQYLKWKIEIEKFNQSNHARSEFLQEIMNIITDASWAKTTANVDAFLEFAKGEYASNYREGTKKFNLNGYRASLRGWKS